MVEYRYHGEINVSPQVRVALPGVNARFLLSAGSSSLAIEPGKPRHTAALDPVGAGEVSL